MKIARPLLVLTFTTVCAGAILFTFIDLAIWRENPDYWKPIKLGHDMMGSELRHGLWKLRHEEWPFFVMPLISLLLVLVMNRSLFWTGYGKATVLAVFIYYVSLTILAWPFLTVH